MGLPLAAQFAAHGWRVDRGGRQSRGGRDASTPAASHVGEEPGLAELVGRVHAEGRLRATLDAASAAREADVVVIIVPVMLDEDQRPDYRSMDAAVASIAPGVHAGSTVIFETTLPIGDTRRRFAPALEAASGLVRRPRLLRRLLPRAALLRCRPRQPGRLPEAGRRDRGGLDGPRSALLRERPRRGDRGDELVGGGRAQPSSPRRPTATSTSRWPTSSPAPRTCTGSTSRRSIAAANSQPYSHIHQPGIGVGGHCIPVYPHLLLAGAPALPSSRPRAASTTGR